MYAKQNAFEHRDKPNKHLARILADTRRSPLFLEVMISKERKEVNTIIGKLKVSSD